MKTKSRILQYTAGTAYGDAVTNSTFFIQELCSELGFKSEIYAGHVAPEFYGQIKHHFQLKPKSNDILLIHHALGHDKVNWLLSLPCKKAIIYHNITPESFFAKDNPIRKDIRLGLKQLKQFLENGADKAISISEYNNHDLLEAGYQLSDIQIIPLLIDLKKITSKRFNQALVNHEKNIPTILFVGRISPNKCQLELLEVAKYLREFFDKPFQFIIAGNYNSKDDYYRKLMSKHDEYQLKDWVQLTGKIPDEDLYGWYHCANCFLCLSEHEGFGVPIVEAMAFEVPVIGFAAGNVSYLLKDAGILIKEKNFPAIALLIKELFDNETFKNEIILTQNQLTTNFNKAQLTKQLSDFIQSL